MTRSNLALLYVVLISSLIVMGCGDKKKKRKKGGGGEEAAAATEESPAEASKAAAATEPEAEASVDEEKEAPIIPSVDGVPDYEDKGVPSKTVTKAQKHNSKAVKHHGKKRYKKAEKEYLKALNLNPRYEYARYNLACAYALMGQDEKALGLLAQMKAVGTWKSLERVQKSKKDKDFTTLHNDPRFIAIAGDVTVEQPDYKKAAKRFKLKKKSFKGTFEDKRHVRVVKTLYHPMDGPGAGKTSFYDVSNMKQLDARMKKWFPISEMFEPEDFGDTDHWFVSKTEVEPDLGQKWTCKKSCCKIPVEMCGGKHSMLTEICFWPLTADNLLPTKLAFIDCE